MKKKKIRVMARDLSLLSGLNDFYLLSTRQIQELYFNSINIKTVLRRLRLLKTHGYLRRFKTGVNGECIWSLGKNAEDIMAQEIKIKGINRNSLVHDLKANDLRINLESKKLGNNFTSGYLLRHKASSNKSPYDRTPETIPDWIFSMKTKNGIRIIALECELTYKGKRRMNDVFERYHNKKSINHLWYVVPTESFKVKLLNIFKNFPYKKSDSYLWVSTFSELEKSLDEMCFSTIKGEVMIKKICNIPAHRGDHRVSMREEIGVA